MVPARLSFWLFYIDQRNKHGNLWRVSVVWLVMLR